MFFPSSLRMAGETNKKSLQHIGCCGLFCKFSGCCKSVFDATGPFAKNGADKKIFSCYCFCITELKKMVCKASLDMMY